MTEVSMDVRRAWSMACRPHVRPVPGDHRMWVEFNRYHRGARMVAPPSVVTHPSIAEPDWRTPDRNRGDSLAKLALTGWMGAVELGDDVADVSGVLDADGSLMRPVEHAASGQLVQWAKLGTGAKMRNTPPAHVLVNGQRVPFGVLVDGTLWRARPVTRKSWDIARDDAWEAHPAALRPHHAPDAGSILAAWCAILSMLTGRHVPVPGGNDRTAILGAAFTAPAKATGRTDTEQRIDRRHRARLDDACALVAQWMTDGIPTGKRTGRPSIAERWARAALDTAPATPREIVAAVTAAARADR